VSRARFPDDIPVLFIYGTKDPTSTPEKLSHTRKLIPTYEEVKLEGVGHWVMLQAREEMTQAVLTWLGAHQLLPSATKL
jgi:soluble epoxide hydrolase / lipid-phosphate phosphatase